MSETKKEYLPKPTAFYGCIYNMVQDIGLANGYAIAIHGSLARDLDLIAVPWTEEAIDEFDLVKLIAKTLGGVCRNENGYVIGMKNDELFGKDYTEKPFGRKAYRIYLGDDYVGKRGESILYYIDLSITPKV